MGELTAKLQKTNKVILVRKKRKPFGKPPKLPGPWIFLIQVMYSNKKTAENLSFPLLQNTKIRILILILDELPAQCRDDPHGQGNSDK